MWEYICESEQINYLMEIKLDPHEYKELMIFHFHILLFPCRTLYNYSYSLWDFVSPSSLLGHNFNCIIHKVSEIDAA